MWEQEMSWNKKQSRLNSSHVRLWKFRSNLSSTLCSRQSTVLSTHTFLTANISQVEGSLATPTSTTDQIVDFTSSTSGTLTTPGHLVSFDVLSLHLLKTQTTRLWTGSDPDPGQKNRRSYEGHCYFIRKYKNITDQLSVKYWPQGGCSLVMGFERDSNRGWDSG